MCRGLEEKQAERAKKVSVTINRCDRCGLIVVRCGLFYFRELFNEVFTACDMDKVHIIIYTMYIWRIKP